MPFFGERLREERERLGLSQQQLADLCGVTMRSQRNYEKNERQPDASYLEAFARSAGDVLYIITGKYSATECGLRNLSSEIDVPRLTQITDMLEGLIQQTKRRWPARELAITAAEVYNILVPEQELDEAQVGKILKLVVNR
ncbi:MULTISPECIES: helix-turn-helix domain-containing protein [Pseudomonas]|uniref:Helix-turn-helix domain protein n=1 Tax=Pseudomonas fluorescens TaxID=294 RepID=A0A109L064_PSEFL|nr:MULTISPECIES: helix-turn-helix transcriptional regulator [Pseudomonas]KWV78603.1 Helix-turn-helix domain protein [Pseudomonas fluorescens]MBA1297764.1 helix-turn-helix transcriptional regulator [Pseudomonas carnis]MDH0796262.1 helix-turn-helix domain-containing protein [Pseudomonas carnis]QHA99094.1 helix-turn-helix domain-containing protein [Pseudomonas sp. J380]